MNFEWDRKGGFVYCAMDAEAGICKIGMSESETNRTKSLSTGYPGNLVSEVVRVDDKCECENYLHRLFSERRIKGEWFKSVSYEDFFTAIRKYKDEKIKQRFNSIDFYRFLYSTDYENKNGIPVKIRQRFTEMHSRVFIFTGYEFNDADLFINKCGSALINLMRSGVVRLVYPIFKNEAYDGMYKNSKYKIEYEHFFATYDYKTRLNKSHYIENCIERLGTCCAAIFFCTKENKYIRQMVHHCMANNIKFKVVISDKKTKFLKSNYSHKNYIGEKK